jgi:hypothetical protein
MNINNSVMKKFQNLALKNLSGEWVVLGGSVLHLLNIDERVTIDIDLAKKSGATDETLTLMNISEKLNLPITSINQAASFFLYKIPNWEKQLVLIAQSKICKLYRPNATLYIILKIQRMSESDLQDCIQMINFSKIEKESIEKLKILKEIKKKLTSVTSDSVIKNLTKLKFML